MLNMNQESSKTPYCLPKLKKKKKILFSGYYKGLCTWLQTISYTVGQWFSTHSIKTQAQIK